MQAIIERILSWGLETRERNGRHPRGFLRTTSHLWGPGLALFGSQVGRELTNGAIAAYLTFKPTIGPSKNPKRDRLIGYFNSLDAKKKQAYARKLTYEYALRALRKYRSFVTNADKGRFSDLTAVSLSLGGSCNLHCTACVMASFQSERCADLEDVDYILKQVEDAGAAYVSVIGAGEPFLEPAYGAALLRCMKRHRALDFFAYTNGTTMTEELARAAGELDNLLMLVSVEGLAESHDQSRGTGTFARAMNAFRLLRDYGVPCGFSAVVNADNYREVTSLPFIEAMAEAGALIGAYNQSCALSRSDTRNFTRESPERDEYLDRLKALGARSPIYVVDLFSFEEKRYGCRAKKGTSCFIDANSGKVAPCFLFPFASHDSNVYDRRHDSRLGEILSSEFFNRYRKGPGERHLCVRDVKGELHQFLENPALAARDRETIRSMLEVVE